jgi:L-cystine transport system permease protein
MNQPFELSYLLDFFPRMLPYLGITLYIVALSILFGLVVGLLVALPRLYNIPVLKRVSEVYVSFFRGTPILIQLFLIYYGLPEILKIFHMNVAKWPVLFFVILAYTLHAGAFISEIIRAAVNAVDRGQMEAAYSIGMTGYQAFTRIMVPQALAIAIPVFTNHVLGTLKDTSLAYTLGVMDITGKSTSLGTATLHFIEVYIDLSLIYLVISMVLEKLFFLLERRLQRFERPVTTDKRLPKRGTALAQMIVARFGKGG